MEFRLEEMGKRIATRRKEMKLKQQELAERVEISSNHLSSIERGKESCSLETMINICNEPQVTPDYLLMGVARLNNLPQSILDELRLCSPESLRLIQYITDYLVENGAKLWNDKNFV